MKLRLIDDWHKAWKLGSVQFAALFAFLFSIGPDLLHTWAFIPQDLKDALPEGTSRWIAVAALLLTLLGRVFKFERKTPQGEEQ
ncbi:holin [Burkholderia phage vB_BceS_AH2]|uniref:Holin n=1 Tax=Burkholderia phage vB_BceS_AH2 TaxID=1133022 RepID=I6NSG3_9CAUD|nr:holin [Burkholderia phage vB_BceS_AH2]AEY69552.1 holin [Burkholderia phage vB_BceS_AH2]